MTFLGADLVENRIRAQRAAWSAGGPLRLGAAARATGRSLQRPGEAGAGDRMGRTRAVASRRARQAVWAAVPCPRMERSQWERPGPCPGPRDGRAGRPWGPSGCPHARPPCCGEAAHRERVCPQAAATALGGRVKTGRPSGARWGRAEAPARPRCPPWASAVPPEGWFYKPPFNCRDSCTFLHVALFYKCFETFK